MRYPIACYILTLKEGATGILANREDEIEKKPGYILQRRVVGKSMGQISFIYEVVDMEGNISWVYDDSLLYEMSDIHERFRKLKQ